MFRRKTGTVVTGRTPHHSLRIVYNYFCLHSRAGGLQTSTVRVLDYRRCLATEDEITRLALDLQREVHDIHRLRLVDGRPVMHETVIIPVHLAPAFSSDPGEIPDRIYLSLWQDHGLKISAIREQLEAVLADDRDRRLLGLPEPAAILLLNKVAYDESARPVLLNLHHAMTREDVYINEVQ